MSDYLNGLTPEFRSSLDKLITLCSNSGLVVRISSGLRTPLEQAMIWRRGREISIIVDKVGWLKSQGCYYLASCIQTAGPQSGEWATNAIPGESFHNYGEAADFLAYDHQGKPINDGNDPTYVQFQKLITLSGLNNYGTHWTKDAGHVQLRPGSPVDIMNIQEMDKVLSERYPL